ncbi:TTC39/IML2 family protein [Granulicella arctica]|uniref:TTC39/IML2 family protein n=1 Tax=Granulicella arctica TaxID=940613 RepID=UPI0021DFB651|nr:TTC39/IML2 family protein [Granulicella arctica]
MRSTCYTPAPASIIIMRILQLVFCCLLLATPAAFAAASYPAALDRGYRDLYNLDFASAHTTFQQYAASHPEDPMPVASDAAAYLFGEFDRLHIIDVQLFADQDRFDHRSKLTPDPAVRRAFDDRTTQAGRLADTALSRNPKDANALYVKTCISGMQSDYALLIEKRDLAALNLSKQSSALSKQVLAVDPTMYDAYLASGVENYMLSLKPAPIRFFLGITGSATNKEEGIRLLRITAQQGHYLAPFARMMLAVAALRDNRPQEAKNILVALSKQFPRNSLYQREIARIPQ